MSNTLGEIIRRLKAQEGELRRRGVAHLAVFGSVARGEDRPDSDVDIAVEIESGRSFSLIRMEDTRLLLEDRLGRHVGLGEATVFAHRCARRSSENACRCSDGAERSGVGLRYPFRH